MARKRKPTVADREMKAHRSKPRVVIEGNKQSIYKGDDFYGVVEKIDHNRWKYRNRIGNGGEVKTEREAFMWLGFRLIPDPQPVGG